MKTNKSMLFSLTVSDSDYFNDAQNKIELVSCPGKDMKCKGQLSVINKCYSESEKFRREKNYQSSIEKLKYAFYITLDLKECQCLKCTKLFRSTITESLENIHGELESMTKGIFGNNHYRPSYLKAEIVLKEFENLGLSETLHLNITNDGISDNHLKNCASF